MRIVYTLIPQYIGIFLFGKVICRIVYNEYTIKIMYRIFHNKYEVIKINERKCKNVLTNQEHVNIIKSSNETEINTSPVYI